MPSKARPTSLGGKLVPASLQTAAPQSRNGLRDKRIGLVLAGGGGKGAYQAGCLQGLYDLNIRRFHVICGTSVGALNGAAAAAGKIPELQKLWREITTASVLRLSWRIPSMLPLLSSPFSHFFLPSLLFLKSYVI